MHILTYAGFVTNNIFLLLMFTVTHRKTSNFDMCLQKFSYTCHFCFIWKIMYHIKRNCLHFNCPQRTSIPCFRFFLIIELEKIWNISFLRDFQWPFEWYVIWLCSEKEFFPYLPVITPKYFLYDATSRFPCILKPWCYIKNWSAHKEQSNDI